MSKILLIGKSGQLARAFQAIYKNSAHEIFVTSRDELDITNASDLDGIFKKHPFDICINCAAYTAVDQAETEVDAAFALNSAGVGLLGQYCKNHGISCIHFSTDYVYHNGLDRRLKESDPKMPRSVYARSKWEGEQQLKASDCDHLIFRISWLYAPWGKNFPLTMRKLAKTQKKLKVVDDQIGCPTYSLDLAADIARIIDQKESFLEASKRGEVFNYSQEGVASWYDFARKTLELSGKKVGIEPVDSSHFPTVAERPSFSLFDTSKLKSYFQLDLRHWEKSLLECIRSIH